MEQLTGMLTNLKVELFEPILVKGYPKEEDLKAIEILADQIKKKHDESELIIT